MEKSKKSFWQKPENLRALILPGTLAGITIWKLPAILGWIGKVLASSVVLLQNGIYFFILVVVAGLIASVVSDRKFWINLWYINKMVTRAITNFLVSYDPVGLIRITISDLNKKLNVALTELNKVSGAKKVVEEEIKQNRADKTKALKLAGLAKEKNDTRSYNLQLETIGMLDESFATYDELYKWTSYVTSILERLRDAAQFNIDRLTIRANGLEKRFTTVNKVLGATSSAWSAMKGDPDKMEVLDQAIQGLVDNCREKTGMIENMLNLSQDFIQNIDLQRGVFSAAGLEQLQQWEQGIDNLRIGSDDDQKLLTLMSGNAIESELAGTPGEKVPVNGNKKGRYDKFFK